MKKKRLGLLLAAVILLCGCQTVPESAETTAATAAVETEPAATTPADGNPEDVTCKGSYTGQENSNATVATVGEQALTNEALLPWYLAQIAEYQQTGRQPAPDFSLPLDTQSCPIDETVNSWQQYFLKGALNAWHTAQALACQSLADEVPIDESYNPNQEALEKYMTGMAANRFLYGFNKYYQLNTQHEAYLDAIPRLLTDLAEQNGYASTDAMAKATGVSTQALESFVRDYNYGYMYYTSLTYSLSLEEAEVESWFTEREADYAARDITRETGKTVDFRQILLIPENGDWDSCQEAAKKLLQTWKNKTWETEGSFSEYAYQNSQDAATVPTGGIYRNIPQGSLPAELDAWCFDPARAVGDTAVLKSDLGWHILYFCGSREIWYTQAEQDLLAREQQALLETARERFPMEVEYASICLPASDAQIGYGEVLYPDVAHQRYPEVPLYLQQDYLGTWYGAYELRSHGCGITTFSMLSSYMMDLPYIPPIMCERYGQYCHYNGTDGMIFHYESPVIGFFLKEKTYEFSKAKQALRDGHIVVSIQHKGYWTGGGHYILLEKINDDDMVQVRDSNLFNYGKLPAHKNDLHAWKSIQSAGSGYWIFEKKAVTSSICSRCGDGTESMLSSSYLCPRCRESALRRATYLTDLQ